ncbi:hypothetical protein CANINC_000895 [Pichia inconspicua]|uniref:Uncharacterized protein n=1 Tax=Pichia inconspicua TaxID=52247 RepID=A0A4T0X507_9ASCO|nr:hypothetical protein CANINC_000895 [[Candida] inconspicua]
MNTSPTPTRRLLFKRKEKCTGDAQMCQTGVDTTNTLTICLAVIIPVVVIGLIVGFFAFKAYRRNKKEFQEEANDPDFNGDNIVLPDYPRYAPPRNMMQSTDSFGDKSSPFNEKSIARPPLAHSQSNISFQPYAENMSQFALPFGNSKDDLDRYSKNLGLDFHEFNYPINKITNSPAGSRANSLAGSRRASYSSSVRPLSGYNKPVSPTKTEDTIGSTKEVSTNSKYYPQEESIEAENIENPENPFHEDTEPSTSPNSSDLSKAAPSSGSNTEEDVMDVKDGEIPQLEPHEVDVPLSPEEEQQLDRMKSVYQVYFSRNGSRRVKRHDDDNDEFVADETQKLPNIVTDETQKMPNIVQDEYPQTSHDPVPQDNDDSADYRASVSSSVYLPVDETVPPIAGNYAHQQFGNLVNHQQQQQYRQYQQYPQQQYPQQYQQQHYQQQYQQQPYQQQPYPQQPYPQQHYQQHPYQQYAQQPQYAQNAYHGYASDMRNQQYNQLPALEKLPLPHQLNKRTSTLESMTTFTAEKKNRTLPAVPVNQNFDPISHVNWADGQRQGSTSSPSPSQIRKSIVMFNPVGLSESKTYVSKGTAKERVRALGSPSGNGPLYGFYENVPERPHGAENLIPRNGSQLDLRRNLDNVNV